jgi:hypothetical protein
MSDPYTLYHAFRGKLLRMAGALTIGLLASAQGPASAQVPCLPHEKLVELLRDRHAEKQVGIGIETGGHLFEIFATADGSTWTMVVTAPDGASCILATGLEWQPMQTEPSESET